MNLTLTLKRVYFEQIASGQKKVEFRKLSPYYERLFADPRKWTSITFHYYRRERLDCRVVRIRKVNRPAKFAKSEYLNTSKIWAIYLDEPKTRLAVKNG